MTELQRRRIRLQSPSFLRSISIVMNVASRSSNQLVAYKGKEEEFVLPNSLEYLSCLLHLAVFGILGAITRYLLQKLFGPTGARVTSDGSILYLDLLSNMVGSFLMGWFGVIFKADIARFSEFLAIGLSTGYLGSLTTFSVWNQKMLDLSADGRWVYAVLGFLLGLFLTSYSIILGVETAKDMQDWAQESADGVKPSPTL